MRHDQAAALEALGSLRPANARLRDAACRVCGEATRFFDVVDFNKHCSFEDPYRFGAAGICVPYHRCDGCGFISSEFFHDWTTEDFARFIYNADYLKVDSEYAAVRPTTVAVAMAALLRGCEDARILDYGSGNGAFGERMRDAGFCNVENYDPFSSPYRPQGRFDIVTCFEVIEHTASPVAAFEEMANLLTNDGIIIFSQTLQPDDIMRQRGTWWYLAPRNGHISAFTPDTLALIAARTGLAFHHGEGPYALARPRPSARLRPVLATMGDPVVFARLRAPGAAGHHPGWHAPEMADGESFRWTAASRVSWEGPQVPSVPCRLRVSIPLVNRITNDFISGCCIRCGPAAAPLLLVGSDLRAEVAISTPEAITIVLCTPDPLTPRALNNTPDDRPLGLAIIV